MEYTSPQKKFANNLQLLWDSFHPGFFPLAVCNCFKRLKSKMPQPVHPLSDVSFVIFHHKVVNFASQSRRVAIKCVLFVAFRNSGKKSLVGHMIHRKLFISLRLMPPAFAGLETASSMARSTTKSSSSNNSTILSIASSMARSTTKSNSNSSNNQQQQ